jgi:hypothetical protein
VFDSYGNNDTGSNELLLQTPENDPPDAVPIAVNLTGDSLTVEVSWLKADDDDFDSYRVYRDIDGTIDVPAIKIINNRNTVSFIDHVPAVDQYYYQVEVFDKQGKSTGSEIVSINVPW